MGSPKRNRKKYVRPKNMWNKLRIEEEHKIKQDYGLKNLSELWRATSEIRRIRKNVREVLSGKVTDEIGKAIIARLSKYSIIKSDAVLDDLLLIMPETILERRLQTVVMKRGLAKTYRQSRQLIAHGFIAISGRRVKSPGYLVSLDEESRISYYKPININAGLNQPEVAPQTVEAAATGMAAETAPEAGTEKSDNN